MKVGDLVKWTWTSAKLSKWRPEHEEDGPIGYGIILQLSETGHDTLSAKVLSQSGKVQWLSTHNMEIVSEG
jgi:hypothetical protein